MVRNPHRTLISLIKTVYVALNTISFSSLLYFDTVTCKLEYGQRTFDYFGSIFFKNFIAGSKCTKLFDYKQYLFKNLGIMHDSFFKIS